MSKAFAAASGMLVLIAAPNAFAQVRPDSAQKVDPLVVTAERTGTPLASSAAAVTRLTSDELRRLPARTVADALGYVPGITLLRGDGLGLAPRLVVRGFYGGGETEYVTVLIDGVPAMQLATGQVNWDLVPLDAIESIEVVRGGASSLYGDAAVGGVVNLITRRDRPFTRWHLRGGEFGQAEGGGALGGKLGPRSASLFGDVRRSTGYRTHEKRDAASVGGSLGLVENPSGALTLSALSHWRTFDEPGPLADAAAASNRRSVAPFYRFDDTDDQLHRLSLDGAAKLGTNQRLTGYVTGEYGRTDAVRTFPLSATFADTKDRRSHTGRGVASLQYQLSGTLGSVPSRLVLGTDLTAGRLASTYRKVLTGNEAAYSSSTGAVGAVDTKGSGRRTSAATFASWEVVPADPLRITLGGRMDWIDDRYEPRAPSTGNALHASRRAFSPRIGANLRYLRTATSEGNAYVTAGKSFKAPTMDQLFDQRRSPVPFPPFAITTSNPTLQAQYGKSIEGGLYQRVSLSPSVNARLALSTYQTDMRNELDFDIKTFKYVNIGESRHRGLEAGLTLDGPQGIGAFGNYTLQNATARNGGDAGNYLKAIPRNVFTAGLTRTSHAGLSGTLSATRVGDTFLDDANTNTLPGHTQVDLRASYPVLHTRLSIDLRNVFDSKYSSTGFPDPAGSRTTFYYPAAGRVVVVGLESGW